MEATFLHFYVLSPRSNWNQVPDTMFTPGNICYFEEFHHLKPKPIKKSRATSINLSRWFPRIGRCEKRHTRLMVSFRSTVDVLMAYEILIGVDGYRVWRLVFVCFTWMAHSYLQEACMNEQFCQFEPRRFDFWHVNQGLKLTFYWSRCKVLRSVRILLLCSAYAYWSLFDQIFFERFFFSRWNLLRVVVIIDLRNKKIAPKSCRSLNLTINMDPNSARWNHFRDNQHFPCVESSTSKDADIQ